MANPATRHAHSVAQVFEFLSIPAALRDKIEHLLVDRDRVIEDAIDAGVRKTMSLSMPGSGGNIVSVFPAYVNVVNLVRFNVEKVHTSSRFEVDATLAGEQLVAPSIVYAGINIVPVDGSAAAIDVALGNASTNVGFGNLTFHAPAGLGLVAALYQVTLRVAVAAAGSPWNLDVDSYSSMRVTESLY